MRRKRKKEEEDEKEKEEEEMVEIVKRGRRKVMVEKG